VSRARRWRQADENDEAIATRIPAKVDIDVGFPVVDGPNVASLIDDDFGLTHHRDEAGRSACTVQGIAVVQKHLAAC